MKKILICDDDFDVREILSLIIESEFDNPIIKVSSGNQGIEKLKTEDNIGVVISDYHMPDGDGKVVIKYNSESSNLPLFLLTGEADEDLGAIEGLDSNPTSRVLFKPLDADILIENIAKALNQGDHILSEDYRRLKVKTVNSFYFPEISYYLNIKDIEYKELIKVGMSKEETYNKITDHESVYVKENDFKLFLGHTSNFINKKIDAISSLPESLNVTSEVMELLMESSNYLDISPLQLRAISSSVNESFENITNFKEMTKLMSDTISKSSYIVGHSLLAIQFATVILKKMGFSQSLISEKIISAALLHDVILEDDVLASVFTKDTHFNRLIDYEKEKIIEHAHTTATLFEKNETIHADILKMIYYHHELPDGSGFPRGENSENIPVVCAIFNVSLRAGHFFYFNGISDQSIGELIHTMSMSYDRGQYKKPYNILKEILGN